ncbi:methyltransferase domain-containing protein [bacterium]|nr:methyltransferase domain-containing protein [bacterium]
MNIIKGLPARMLTYRALLAAHRGAGLEGYLDRLLAQEALSIQDNALAYAICMAVYRHLFKIDRIIDEFTPSKKIDDEIRIILQMGTAQWLYFSKIPSHAIVSTSVDLVRKIKKSSATGFVNAVMRKITSSKIYSFDYANDIEKISVEYSHPRWLIERWIKRYGMDFTIALVEANNEEPPLTIRVNTRALNVEDMQNQLLSVGIANSADEDYPEYLTIEEKRNPAMLPGFTQGHFTVQDPAFGLPVWILAPRPGEKVLEIGCAPGGKLSHLAEIAGGDIELHGVDISPERIGFTSNNLDRLGLLEDVHLQIADVLDLDMKGYYDAILLDVPCSSLGVIRRHPEIRYNRKPDDIESLAILQHKLIDKAVSLLAPRGRLIYCSCSTEPQEGEDHFSVLPAGMRFKKIISGIPSKYKEGDFVRTWPQRDNLDGAFIASVELES